MTAHSAGQVAYAVQAGRALRALILAGSLGPVVGLVAGPIEPARAEPASAVQNLAGRWVGNGWIETSGGQREQVKCIATYILKDAGKGIEQNLRCASTSYKIDAQTQLAINGDKLTGTWEERSFVTSGSVSGQVRTGGFNVLINGNNFSARMSVASGKGSQTLNILPTGLTVSKITIGLTRG